MNVNESNPAHAAVAITKSDSTVLTVTRSLYVGTTGDVAVVMQGATVLFPSVPAGAILPICVTKVLSANTTASGFVGLY